MALKDFFWGEPLWRRKAMRASPEVLESIRDRSFSGFPLIATPRVSDQIRQAFERATSASYGWMYQTQPSVRAVVDYMARNVAQLHLRLYERTSDIERHEASDHPAAVTLRNPNASLPGQKLIFDLVRDHLVYGNAYLLKMRASPEAPRTLVQLPPARTSVMGPGYFTVDAYRIYRTDGSHFDRPPEDIMHWLAATEPADPRLGLSPLETLRKTLAEESATQAANVELLKSGLLMPGYIGRPLDAPEWTEQAAERFREKWASSVKDSGRHTPILEEGMEFHDFGVSPKDAEMLGGRRFTREEVCAVYGLPMSLVGGAPSEEDRAQFYADVLPPICEMLATYLDLSIVTGEFSARDHYFEFDLDEKLQGDERLKALTSASGAPVLTRNESRAMLNKPPKPGGDELVTPLNVIVGGKPSPQVMPVQDPNKPSQEGDAREQSMNGKGKALLIKRRETQRNRRDRYAVENIREIRGFLAALEQEARLKSANDFDLNRWVKKLKAILLKLMRSTVEREGKIAAARMGLDAFAMATVEHYLAKVAEGEATDFTLKIRDDLQTQSAREVFTHAREINAEGLGEMLATKMTNFAHTEAGGMTPDAVHRLKRWLVDDLEVSAHPEMDHEQVPLTENFSNGKSYPPFEHPRCKCMVEIT